MIDVFGNGYRDYLVVERERRGGAGLRAGGGVSAGGGSVK